MLEHKTGKPSRIIRCPGNFDHAIVRVVVVVDQRSLDEIAANKAHFENTTLEQFVKKSEYEGYGLEDAIGDSVLSGRIKPLDAMSVGEMTFASS